MLNRKKMLKAGSLYLLGNLFDKAVAFITIPIFTRLLATNEYGIVTTYLSWESILSVVLTLSLGNSLRTAVIDFPQDMDGYMSSILTLELFSAAGIGSGLCLAAYLTHDSLLIRLLPLCCVHSLATGVIQAVQTRYMMEMRYIPRTALQCITNLLVVLLSILLITRSGENRYLGRIYAYLIVFAGAATFYILYYFIKGKTYISTRFWRYALTFSLPVIFHSLSLVVLSQADRSMLMWMKSASEAGIYGLAYQFGQLPLVITTTMENVWIPWFISKLQAQDRQAVNRQTKQYLTVGAILCSGIMLAAPEVLKFMTTQQYYSATRMIAPVVAATYLMFLAGISIQLEYLHKKTKVVAVNTVVAAVINIALNFIFIPMYGGVAAAFTTLVAYMISFFMHYRYARKLDGGLFDFSVYIFPLVLVMAVMLFVQCSLEHALLRWCIGIVFGALFIKYCFHFIRTTR